MLAERSAHPVIMSVMVEPRRVLCAARLKDAGGITAGVDFMFFFFIF